VNSVLVRMAADRAGEHHYTACKDCGTYCFDTSAAYTVFPRKNPLGCHSVLL
jgi:hypothetical protein